MGVKNLWSILSPVCERKSLWELQGNTVAIDLSCWVCDSQHVENTTQPRMYLRNLFFRTACLLLLGVKPIFVLEGKAPILKHDVMSQRVHRRYKNKKTNISSEEENDTHSQCTVSNKNTGSRSKFNSILKQCEELLNIMGVPCLQSAGEAEALCAQLNSYGLVEGCITQDGDCFLYGACTVFRNFTISHQGSAGCSVEVYNMSVIEEKLSLSREKLIALSLLCGCDYNDKGVLGVGKKTALEFLQRIPDNEVLKRLKQWRTDPRYEQLENECVSLANTCSNCSHSGKLQKHNKSGCLVCGLLKGCIQDTQKIHLIQKDSEERKQIIAELSMRRKALQDENFPSEAMVNEFLQKQPLSNLDLSWKSPDLTKFIKYSVNLLNWTESYAVEKFVPLVTRWQLVYLQNCKTKPDLLSLHFSPLAIFKKRIQRSVQCFEVKWKENHDVSSNVEYSEEMLTTIEPQDLIRNAYPDLVMEFTTKTANTKKGKSTKKSKTNQTNVESCVCHDKEKEENMIKQSHLCKFFKTNRVGEMRNVLGNLNIDCDVEKQNLKKNKISSSRKEIKKKTIITCGSLKTLCENVEANSERSVKMNESKSEALDDVQLSFQNLSLREVKSVGIVEEFNSLDVDDEISNISGLIEGIVDEYYPDILNS